MSTKTTVIKIEFFITSVTKTFLFPQLHLNCNHFNILSMILVNGKVGLIDEVSNKGGSDSFKW